MIKRYAPSAEPVEAILLSSSNLDEAAKWCGGEVKAGSPQSLDEAWDRVVLVPGIPTAFSASVGWYLVKGPNNRFKVWEKSHFEREYHEVGKRQDGLQMRGDYPDPRLVTRSATDYVGMYGSGVRFGE